MRSTRRLTVLVTGAVLALGSLSAASSQAGAREDDGARASGDAVRAWNEFAVNMLNGLPGPAGGAPPAAQVHVAMVQAAVFDAVNAIGQSGYQPYLLEESFPSGASEDAAVAAAANGVLHNIVSTVPNIPDATRTTLLATLATRYADALAAIPDGSSEVTGVDAGEAAALAMVTARADDGRFGPSQWDPDPDPGHWWPLTDAGTGQPILDPTPWVGGVDLFALASDSQFRTAGPPELDSERWERDFNEVKELGAVNSTVRTPTQTYIAKWWQSTPVRSWNQVGRELSLRAGLDALDTARLFALQNLGGADASIRCWNDKYYWDFWRPWNAIQRAAEDGHPDTEPDAAWMPLISAPYPDTPSGHLCLDGSHTYVLRMFFGDKPLGGYSITSVSGLLAPAPADPRTRHFDTFSDAVAEIVEARIWAGLHYRFADRQAKSLGVDVAKYTAKNYLLPVHPG